MGTSQGNGGRTSAATVAQVQTGYTEDESDFQPAHRGRTAVQIDGLREGLARQIRQNAGVFYHTGPKSRDVTFKAQVDKWVKSFGLDEGVIAVTYSAPSPMPNDELRRGVKVRIADDALRAKVAEKLTA